MSTFQRPVSYSSELFCIGIINEVFFCPFLISDINAPVIFKAINPERKHKHCSLKAVFFGNFCGDCLDVKIFSGEIEIYGNRMTYKCPTFITQLQVLKILFALTILFGVLKIVLVNFHCEFLSIIIVKSTN